MKQRDIQFCARCRKGLAHHGHRSFLKASTQRFVLDARAIQSQHGLEMFFGGGSSGAALAQIMGPDPDIATPVGPGTSVLICDACLIDPSFSVGELSDLEPCPVSDRKAG